MTGPKPSGPTHPTPTGPPKADPQTPAHQSNRPSGSPQAGGPAKPPVMPNTRVPLVFDEGRDRLVGRVWEPPMPGSPPGPPPDPGPPAASDPPDPTPIPNPHPYPPPVRPGLSWLPALALPSLLLLAAIDHAAWLASL